MAKPDYYGMKRTKVSRLASFNTMIKTASLIAIFLLVSFLPSGVVSAIEPFCPGGSDPNSQILWCSDFDNLSNCSSGTESQCWKDNSWAGFPSSLKGRIEKSKGAVGNGFVVLEAEPGTTGSGFTDMDIPGDSYDAINLRYYVKFGDTYLDYGSDHGPGIKGYGTGGKVIDVTLDQSPRGYYLYVPNTCKVGSFNLPVNKPRVQILNGRWYLIEIQVIVDTQCTDSSSPHGCNGNVRLWVDEQLVLEYTDINFGGTTNGIKWSSIWGPRNYYHALVPAPFGYNIYYDNFVISNGVLIGPAKNENSRDEGDPLSVNYKLKVGVLPFVGGRPKDDCAPAAYGYLGTEYGYDWGASGGNETLTSEQYHNHFQVTCSNRPDLNLDGQKDQGVIDGSLKVTGKVGGVFWDGWGHTPLVIHGYVFIPSGQGWKGNEALFGSKSYSGGSDYGDYVAAAIDDSSGTPKWAVVRRVNAGTPSLVWSSDVKVSFDAWNEFELLINPDDEYFSFMVNGKRLADRRSCTMPSNWHTLAANYNIPDFVLGIIDSDVSVTLYYDDANIGSVSFWSCDGWSDAACPFSEHTKPASPTKLRIVQ